MPRPGRKPARVPAKHETSLLQKIENSGNEAKKWLKTKEVTIFSDAQFAHLACKLTPNRAQKAPKNHILCKTNSGFPVGGKVGAVTNSRLQGSAADPLQRRGHNMDWFENPELRYNPPRFARTSVDVGARRRLALLASEGRAQGLPLRCHKREKKT
jgi:hypothetical protein